jgi:hypothetical protein
MKGGKDNKDSLTKFNIIILRQHWKFHIALMILLNAILGEVNLFHLTIFFLFQLVYQTNFNRLSFKCLEMFLIQIVSSLLSICSF